MSRFYILKGDPTTSGGRVATGLDTNTWHGKSTAWENDKIECPACKSTGIIKCAGSRVTSSLNLHGQQQALNGDLCICKCNPPPLLIATQNTYGTGGEAKFGESKFTLAFDLGGESSFHEQFRIKDEGGLPVANTPYFIIDGAGKTFKGISDKNGCCERIFTDGAQKLHVFLGVAALERWQ